MVAPSAHLPVLNRGTHDGADCASCPFSVNGAPKNPVYSEFPDEPDWLVIGEGPGFTEVRLGRPFMGPSGQVVNKILGKIGKPREEVYVGNATLCRPPDGTPEPQKTQAAVACRGRMQAELARWPGKPILTLGAIAARSIIPKETLDAIDPPDAPRAIRRSQKMRQQPSLKSAIQRRKRIKKQAEKQLDKLIKHERKRLITEIKVKYKHRPPESYLREEINRVFPQLEIKAKEDAEKIIDLKIKERELKKLIEKDKPKKPRKPKKIKISDIASTLFDVDVDGTGVRPVIPAIHPAALLRGGGASIGGSHTPDMAFVNLIYDAAKVNALAKGQDIRLYLNVEYEMEDADRAFRLFLEVYNDALQEGACSIDLETYVDDPDRHHALMAYVARIRVIGIATKRMAYSVAWDLLPPICQTLLQVMLVNVETTYHNGLYDRTVLRAYGFQMGPKWFDTLLAHHAAFPGNSHKLQHVDAQFYGVAPWKSEFRNAEETPEKLAIYNAKDTGGTHALRPRLQFWMKKTDTTRVFDLDLKMSDAASAMHLAGMPIDRDINEELLKTFTKTVVDARRHVEDIAHDSKRREEIWHHLALQQARKQRKLDPPDFEERYQIRLSAMKLDPDWKWKIGASKHIAALLLAMGVPLYQTTTGGDVSTKKEILESLTEESIVRDILDYREADKLLSTFVYPVFDRYDALGNISSFGFADELDRIHPIWNVHRITGRWASQWPVVSNVPKDKWKKLTAEEMAAVIAMGIEIKGPTLLPDGRIVRKNKDDSLSKMVRPNLRRQVRVNVPGRILVGFDFGQIEARVIALISGDAFLCSIFADGRDPHIECARIIWPHFDTLDPDTRKGLRENVKNIEYGYLYMAQLDTLHKTMLKAGNLIKLEDLAVAIKGLENAMPDITGWHQSTIARASTPPYEIKDFILGRRRTWPMGNVEGPESVNFGVQTAAASIMNTGMSRMMPKLAKYKQAYPIAQIHDAAVFECWEEDAKALAEDVSASFVQHYERDGRSIPFPIDLKIGHDWSQV